MQDFRPPEDVENSGTGTTGHTPEDEAWDNRQRAVASANPDGNLQRQCFEECETAGWDPERRLSFAEEIAHLHEEVSEAFRAYRQSHDFAITYRDDGKPEGVPVEFADVLIGMFYNAELHGFDLLEAVEIKHRWNLERSYEAEGRQLHREVSL